MYEKARNFFIDSHRGAFAAWRNGSQAARASPLPQAVNGRAAADR